MKTLRLVFMGTPAFALPALRQLHHGPHHLVRVVTRPDRPQGRGRRLVAPAVKTAALELGLAVGQPFSADEEWQLLQKTAPDLIVTAAYGRLLSSRVLALPPLGCINLHPSLLPAFRGAAPIQRAVMAGAAETGVTVMRLVPEMDAGDIILQESLPIGPEETAGELYDRLAVAAGKLLSRAVHALATGMASFTPQDPQRISFAPPLLPSEERLDWHQKRVILFNLIRGMAPRPGAYTTWRGSRLKVLRAALPPEPGRFEPPLVPGSIHALTAGAITVAAGDGLLDLLTVQPAGKRPMAAPAFARGYALGPGDRFTGRIG